MRQTDGLTDRKRERETGQLQYSFIQAYGKSIYMIKLHNIRLCIVVYGGGNTMVTFDVDV